MGNNVLLLWDRMGDYHRARWKALKLQLPSRNVFAGDLAGSDDLYRWHTEENCPQYFRLSSNSIDQINTWVCLRAFMKLVRDKEIKYVCIPGYGRFVYLLMIAASKLLGIKVLMFAESWYPSSRVLDRLKQIFLKTLVDKFFLSGARAWHHFVYHFNIPTDRIITGYSVVENRHFSNFRHFASLEDSKNKPVLLCVARYAPEKNLALLIEGFKESKLLNSWSLRIVGAGPLKKELEKLAAGDAIQLLDWLHYDQLSNLYHGADCFILPSIFEPWGLVVNEAMAAGLPIIASTQCGCVPDLISHKNGWIFDGTDKDELVAILDTLEKTSWETLQKMGAVSKKVIQKYTPEIWARTIVNAFDISLEK